MTFYPHVSITTLGFFISSIVFTAVGLSEEQREARIVLPPAPPPPTHRPRYARVLGDIETLWQRPTTREVKGVFFAAHGCNHQGTDFFDEVSADGWEFKECKTSNFGRCLGLPEERHLFEVARSRGYLVVSVSGGAGQRSCWDMRDVERVEMALRHVITVEGLRPSIPILAFGASSGGQFVGVLAGRGALRAQLRCIVPQISSIDTGGNVPTLFLHMKADDLTTADVREDIAKLRAKGVRAEALVMNSLPVEEVMARYFPPEVATQIAERLAKKHLLNSAGHLLGDPRSTNWRMALQGMALSLGDSLKEDESRISELMNVARAYHEFSGEYADALLDFCEGK